MAGELQYSIQDYAAQRSGVRFPLPNISSANYDATMTDVGAIQTALDALTLGNINSERVVASVSEPSPGAASDFAARRELKWQLTLQDDVSGEVYLREIPAPDMDGNVIAGGDFADLTSSDWTAFKSAIESGKTISPEGNAWTLMSAKVVGRNL